MNYIVEMAYGNFLIDEMKEQSKMKSYISECLVLSEGLDIFNKVVSIHEAEKGKVTQTWDKFKLLLKAIWDKFVNAFNKITMDNKKYLERYKDVIIKKPLKIEGTCGAYNIGMARITQNKIGSLTFSDQQQQQLKDDYSAQQMILPEYKSSAIEFKVFVKAFFVGGEKGEVPIKETFKNMTDMYNYCHDYDKIVNIIKKDQDTIVAAIDKAKFILIQHASQDEKNNTQSESVSFDYETIYSSILEGYISEDLNIIMPEKAASSTTTNGTNGSVSNNTNSVDDNTVDVDKIQNNSDGKKLEDVQVLLDRYRREASNMLTAKMSAAEQMNRDIMKVIEAHIQSYGGELKKTTSGTANVGTDFTKANAEF